MAIDLIPVTSDGAQDFTIVLDGVTYDIRISYNGRMEYWTMNISTGGERIASGVALVGGVDIVQQYTFSLKDLWAVNLSDADADAGPDNLGIDVQLLKVDQETLDQAVQEAEAKQ